MEAEFASVRAFLTSRCLAICQVLLSSSPSTLQSLSPRLNQQVNQQPSLTKPNQCPNLRQHLNHNQPSLQRKKRPRPQKHLLLKPQPSQLPPLSALKLNPLHPCLSLSPKANPKQSPNPNLNPNPNPNLLYRRILVIL